MCEAETRMRYCETGAILKTVLFFFLKFYFHMIFYPFCIGFSVEIHGIGSDFSVSIEKGYFLSVTVTSSLFPTKADFNLESFCVYKSQVDHCYFLFWTEFRH